ncbi:gamma-glutamyl-phosphate reductase, partial [bacterium]|nr:gamma-glutamyl-phosphate reductase [bacterium]
MSELLKSVTTLALAAKKAAREVALASSEKRTQALVAAAQAIRDDAEKILAANTQDLAAARAKGLTEAMVDRLRLDASRLEAIASACEDVARLPDPVGEITESWSRPNGLKIV